MAASGILLIRGGIKKIKISTLPCLIKRTLFVCFGILFLFGAGEEISWGQRIFGFETPPAIREINGQDEFNVHNIDKGLFDRSLRYGIALASLVAFILFSTGIRKIWGVSMPGFLTILSLILCTVYQDAHLVDKPYWLAAVVCVFCIVYALWKKDRAKLGLGLTTLAIMGLVLMLHRYRAAELTSNSTPEVREWIFSLITFFYVRKILDDLPENQLQDLQDNSCFGK
ncbi:MAG: hypothetical protein KJT03_06205 [Verrucomicrobiae bacterium]|nr:hypothetical protein [Verrucomicrobiae bacterium]